MGLECSPHIGVVTNVTPNHLDEHEGSFRKYIATKERLVRYQRPGDIAVLSYDNLITRRMAGLTPGRAVYFSREAALNEGAFLRGDQLVLRRGGEEAIVCRTSEVRVPGVHNISNLLAASLAAFEFGVAPQTIGHAARAFRGLRHRLQLVLSADGVRYYDDLNSTTPQATVAALHVFDTPVILIAGGEDKGLAFDELAALAVQDCRSILLLPGRGTARLEAALTSARGNAAAPPIQHCTTLEDAVATARDIAQAGDVVLLSPACPYFFSRFYDDSSGGFRALVRKVVLGARGRGSGEGVEGEAGAEAEATSPPPRRGRA
jgi:UDP-N-acetylmuramoylalanine--D-glutamate ligase